MNKLLQRIKAKKAVFPIELSLTNIEIKIPFTAVCLISMKIGKKIFESKKFICKGDIEKIIIDEVFKFDIKLYYLSQSQNYLEKKINFYIKIISYKKKVKLAKASFDISLLISSNKLKKEGYLEFKKGLVTNALLNYKFHINTILTKPIIKTERSFSFIENLQENCIKEDIEMHSALVKPKKIKNESKSSHSNSSKEIINLFTDQEEIELINKVLNLQKSIDEKNNQIFEYIEKIDQLEKANNVKIQILIKKNKDLFEKNKNIEDNLEKTRENENKLLIKINDLENTNQNLRLNLKNKEFDYKNILNDLMILTKNNKNLSTDWIEKENQIEKYRLDLSALMTQSFLLQEENKKINEELFQLQNNSNLIFLKNDEIFQSLEIYKKNNQILEQNIINLKAELRKSEIQKEEIYSQHTLLSLECSNLKIKLQTFKKIPSIKNIDCECNVDNELILKENEILKKRIKILVDTNKEDQEEYNTYIQNLEENNKKQREEINQLTILNNDLRIEIIKNQRSSKTSLFNQNIDKMEQNFNETIISKDKFIEKLNEKIINLEKEKIDFSEQFNNYQTLLKAKEEDKDCNCELKINEKYKKLERENKELKNIIENKNKKKELIENKSNNNDDVLILKMNKISMETDIRKLNEKILFLEAELLESKKKLVYLFNCISENGDKSLINKLNDL